MSTATRTRIETKIETRIRDLTDEVRDVSAQVTRYRLEVLDTSASLEEDLGIDSVRLRDIPGVLLEKYQLTDKLNIPRLKYAASTA
jgi:enoyl-[acyl-carrier protein] reductase III